MGDYPVHPALLSPQMDRQFRRLLGLSATKPPALSSLRRLIRQERVDANRELYEATVATEARRLCVSAIRWAIEAEVVTIPGELLDDG